jgi:putative phosphoesterase
MKIAVLSDIHSNRLALEACIKYINENKIENLLFLGDYVSDCAYPQLTMNLLYNLRIHKNCWFIKGNREEYLLKHRQNENDGWKSPSSASGSLCYTYENLRDLDFHFFESLDIKGHMALEGYPEFEYCHGSLSESRGDLTFGSEGARNALNTIGTSLIVCGHTHEQGTYQYGGKKIVNAGSVGIPWSKEAKAQFAILHSDGTDWEEEFICLDYDRTGAVQELYDSGLTKQANIWAKLVEETLLTGIDHAIDCLNLAYQISIENSGSADWNSMKEEYWEEAARRIGIL